MAESDGDRAHAILCTLLREARKQANLRQDDLAQRLGRPQSFVSKYESGERRLDVVELLQICRALDISLSRFGGRLEEALNAS